MYHIPVLEKEVLSLLNPQKDKLFVDGTLGGGGHTSAILECGARVVAIDRDEDAINNASGLKERFGERLTLVRANFKAINEVLHQLKIDKIDGALLDLGISSHQIDCAERGFSYISDAPLDMRMDKDEPLSAQEVINNYSEAQLAKIFFEYGEERFARKIAARIVSQRPLSTTGELAELIKKTIGYNAKDGHPARRVFQAVRIEVNGELSGLENALKSFVDRLNKGACFAVLTFHSLEDRAVKRVFKELATDCICDKRLPVCVCAHKAQVKIVASAISASESEISQNSRAKSAKLRAVIKL